MCSFETRVLARLLEAFVCSKQEGRSYLLFSHCLSLDSSVHSQAVVLITYCSQEITMGNMVMLKKHRHIEILSSSQG